MFAKVILAQLGVMLCLICTAQTNAPRPLGDMGLAVYRTPAITRTSDKSNVLLPYVFADYGNFFARVDTWGLKLMPMGAGSLEISTRISFEGYKAAGYPGIQDRARPVPLGLSTFQETPYGAFFVYAFHDATSSGSLIDAMYAAEFKLGSIHVYPQFGFERRSARYVTHLYGVSASESEISHLPSYNASHSVSPNLGVAFEYPLANNYGITLQVRKKWLDQSITNSPLVNTQSQTSGFLALTRSFK